MMQYAVLQKYPPEALSDDERCGAVDVLMVGSEQEARVFLAAYQSRHVAACAEFKAGDTGGEWDSKLEEKFEAICQKYQVVCVIDDVEFEIVEVRGEKAA